MPLIDRGRGKPVTGRRGGHFRAEEVSTISDMPPADRRDPRRSRRLQTGGGRRSTDFSLEAAVLASDLNLVLSSVVETVAEGICTVDRQRRIQFVNRESELILCIPRADMRGHTIAELTPKLAGVEGKPLRKAGRPGALAMGQNAPVYDIQMAFTRPDGKVVHLSINAAPLRGATAAATGAVLSVRDVTERIRAESELLTSQQQLRVVDKARRQLIERLVSAQEEESRLSLIHTDAADDLLCVDLGGRRIIKKKQNQYTTVIPPDKKHLEYYP